MPGASICYTETKERLEYFQEPSKPKNVFVLATGTHNAGALHWWKALLAPGRWWSATISKSNQTSISPWSTLISIPQNLDVRVTGIDGSDKGCVEEQKPLSPSSDEAMQYLMEYCEYHNIQNQCAAALSTALVLPLVRRSRRSIGLPVPQSSATQLSLCLSSTPSTLDQEHLDKLLTLSCNCEGIEAILSSCFLNPDVPDPEMSAVTTCRAYSQSSTRLMTYKLAPRY